MTQSPVVRFEELPVDAQEQLHALVRAVEAGRGREVLSELHALTETHAGLALGHFLLGRALRQVKAIESSCDAFERAAQLDPHHCRAHIGLAWARLSQGRYRQAEEHAQRVLVEQLGWTGDAQAVLAEVALERGEEALAADGFLRAYQLKPQWPWLQQHCELVGRPFVAPTESSPPPWPISAIERLWLYAQLEWRLLQEASKRSPDAQEPLTAGCDHTPRWTTGWAEQADVDCVELYQALNGRGGFCDCEVLLNATKRDDEEHAVLIVCGAITHRGNPPQLLSELATDATTALDPEPEGIASQVISPTKTQIPVQVVRGSHLGILLDGLAEDLDAPVLSLVVLHPDGQHLGDVVRLAQGRIEVQQVDDRAALVQVAASARLNAATVGRMLELMPDPGPSEWAMSLPLAPPERKRRASIAPDAPLALLYSDHGQLMVNTNVLSAEPEEHKLLLFEGEASQPVLHPAGRWMCWLRAHRKTSQLILHDRKSGHSRRLLCGKLDAPAFDGAAERLYVSETTGGQKRVLVFSISESGAAEPMVWASAERVLPAPFGNALAVGRGEQWAVADRSGHQLAPPITGRAPVWDPTGTRLALLVRTDEEGEQVFVLQPDGRRSRLSPPSRGCSWLSFTRSGQALVMRCITARHQTPLGDGRIEVREDERLFRSRIDGTLVEELLSYEHSYMRIVQPVSHPRADVVAFRTQDAPMHNRRLVVLSPEGQLHQIAAGAALPLAWL